MVLFNCSSLRSRKARQAPLWIAVALSTFIAGGCAPPPRTVEVVGRVTHNGLPVEGAVVIFFAEQYADDLPAAARTDAEGRYALRTYFSASDIPLGAVPNDYVIAIRKLKRPDIERAQGKMRELAEIGGDVRRYIAEQAAYDLWPDGIPDDWPDGYVPLVTDRPKRYMHSRELRTQLVRLERGIPLLPVRYADASTSGLRASVVMSEEPLTFNFDLTGEIDGSLAMPGDENILPEPPE